MSARDTTADWLALERIPRVGPVTIAKLIESFGSPSAILAASAGQLRARTGVGEKIASLIAEYSPPWKEIARDMDTLNRFSARVISRWDAEYPVNLTHIYDPPSLLFVRGTLLPEDARAVAIVGTRNPTAYGLEMTRVLSRDLTQAGITLVSGLARGVDTECHATVVREGGRTIGVLGCGVDVVYPRENKALMDRMTENGAVISEFRPGTPPLATHFYRRNRIISGLSKGIVVVQAALGSGSLITAKHALDQNRDVLAVPGATLDKRSEGPHFLLKQGAGLVENGSDVLAALFGEGSKFKTTHRVEQTALTLDLDLSVDAGRVRGVLTHEPLHFDLVCEATGLSAPSVSSALLELELGGLARRGAGNVFSLT